MTNKHAPLGIKSISSKTLSLTESLSFIYKGCPKKLCPVCVAAVEEP